MMKLPVLTLLLAAGISGCAAGGGAGPPAAGTPAQTSTAGMGSAIQTTILVPSALVEQSGHRTPQYVSASTLGLKVIVTDVPPTGKTASFTPIASVYTLTVGLNLIVVPTPASAAGHTEDLTYVAYNLAPAANAFSSAVKAVGWGITTGFFAQPGQNTNNVELSGVVDSFAAPLAETGSFGMMSSAPPTLAGAQTSLGFGGSPVPNGIATLNDVGGQNITTAAGGPWPVVGAVPAVATALAAGVPLTIVETAGTCGAVGSVPHLKLSYNGNPSATTASIQATTDIIAATYDGNGGAGWFAIVSAKGQSQTLTYTLSSLAATSTSVDYRCATQTLSFSQLNETALMTIVQHVAAAPYTITVPNAPNCSGLVNVYAGNSTAVINQIPYGVPTSLGALNTFTVQLIPLPPAAAACNIKVQDADAASPGGPTFPGATTYVAASLPSTTYQIIVP